MFKLKEETKIMISEVKRRKKEEEAGEWKKERNGKEKWKWTKDNMIGLFSNKPIKGNSHWEGEKEK